MTTSAPIPPSMTYARELAVALDAARLAAAAILPFYNARNAETYTKGDGSPVTDADLASDRIITETISAAFPDDAILTEEGAKDQTRIENARCWIADPLDGTQQFVAGTDRFEVLLALTVDHRPVVAVSIHPPSGITHAAVAGEGAWRIEGDTLERWTIAAPQDPPRLAPSKWYRGRDEAGQATIARVAEEIGAVVEPVLEIGYQPMAFDETMRSYDAFMGLWPIASTGFAQEWDIAACDLITNEAGGRFTDMWGRLHHYNKVTTAISGGILASSSPELHEGLLAAFANERPSTPPPVDPINGLEEV